MTTRLPPAREQEIRGYLLAYSGDVEMTRELLAELDRVRAHAQALQARLDDYDCAARKFIAKVESGRAYSRETYADLKACLVSGELTGERS